MSDEAEHRRGEADDQGGRDRSDLESGAREHANAPTTGVRQNNNLAQARRWYTQAAHDLASARWSAQGEFYALACFQAQQAAEKHLKAYLYAKGWRGVTGHSTIALLRNCMERDSEFQHLLPACRVLDRFYIPTRYPDALPDGTPHDVYGVEDAEEAIEKSEQVREMVAERLDPLLGGGPV